MLSYFFFMAQYRAMTRWLGTSDLENILKLYKENPCLFCRCKHQTILLQDNLALL